jgi:hypothetical protein
VIPRRTKAVLLACAVAALLAFAPGANAKPGYVVIPGSHSVELNLKGSHGFRIGAAKVGRYFYFQAGDERSVATYVNRSPKQKGDGIKAKFPGIGRISVRFHPQGPPQREPSFFPQCKGGETTKQRGVFVGTIRFRGERGYTSVKATRASGEVATSEKEICKRSIFDDDPDVEADRTELWAYSKSKGRAVGFSASTWGIPESPLTTFSASVVERRRGMTIYRITFTDGKESQLIAGDSRPHPLSATVTPPAPFHGSAEFERTAEGASSWTGTLSVHFPGLDRVALTGPSFVARFCQHSGCHGNSVDGLRLPLVARGLAGKPLLRR